MSLIEMRDRTVKIGQAKAGAFKKNPRNPKIHPGEQLDRLDALFNRYGQIGVLIVYESARNNGEWTIFNGHARQEYNPDQIWNILYTNLTDEEVDEISPMYDKVSEDADPYIEILNSLLEESVIKFEDDPILTKFIQDITTDIEIGSLLNDEYSSGDLPPSLDELESEYGEPQERDFWPYIKVQVSPETKELWDSLLADINIEDEALRVEALLNKMI